MTTFIEKLDELFSTCENFTPDETDRCKWCGERKFSKIHTLKQDILNLVSERIIGEKEYYHEHYPFVRSQKMQEEVDERIARDELRVDQRTTLYEGTKDE